MSQRLASLVILLVAASLGAGCSVFPWWASVNERGGGNKTAASLLVDDDVKKDEMFVGLAISGGGLRAANFGAAVMFELQKLGLLEKVDFISSVSGGSLAAAYYALREPEPGTSRIVWSRQTVDERFSRNLQSEWLLRWFDPRNFLRYWFTAFDRSDIMAQVFDANLFHRATFDHLNRRPKVLFNTTNFVTGRKFVFSNKAFDDLGSDLHGYPVARAAMASGAFPGVFANVTLRNYHQDPAGRYVHLFDGGPIDNLGVGTILKVLQRYLADEVDRHPPADPRDLLDAYGLRRGCFLISVDAYPAGRQVPNERSEVADTRPWYGFLLDPNVFEAFGDLLAVKRNELLHELGLDKEDEGILGSFPLFTLDLDDDDLRSQGRKVRTKMAAQPPPAGYSAEQALKHGTYCHVWHIALSQLSPDSKKQCPLGQRVNRIRTEYRIKKPDQCDLFEAARTLVSAAFEQTRLGELLEQGFPRTGPIRDRPTRLPLDHLNCGQEPEIIPADGRHACRLNAAG